VSCFICRHSAEKGLERLFHRDTSEKAADLKKKCEYQKVFSDLLLSMRDNQVFCSIYFVTRRVTLTYGRKPLCIRAFPARNDRNTARVPSYTLFVYCRIRHGGIRAVILRLANA
jgi:hypothetical protein